MRMKDLTVRQREIVDFIKAFIEGHHYPPTIREIAAHFKISAKGCYDHLRALKKKNIIQNDRSKSRVLEIVDQQDDQGKTEIIKIPILGTVAAGKPLFAEENFQGTFEIAEQVVGAGKFFSLHIRGESMKNVGIFNNDLAIIRYQTNADNGDIIVALIDDSATLKRYFREKNRIRLKAENIEFPDIYTQECTILGKLVLVIRKYE